MRIASAPVNRNNPDVPEYRAWLPYERLMDEFVRLLIAAEAGDDRRRGQAGLVHAGIAAG